jgi:hypothetical protein
MGPYVIASIHTIVLATECEVAVYLIRLRRELMKVVAR